MKVARWLGVCSSAAVLILWLGVIASKQSQYGSPAEMAGTWRVAGWLLDSVDLKMLLLSLLGMLVAGFRQPLLMLLVFLALFILVGLYMLGVPGWARWIGIAILLYLLSALLLLPSAPLLRRLRG